MPWDTNGRLVEAVDCYACNASLEWHGDLPDDEEEWLCSACAEDAAHARGRAEGACIAGIIALGEWARRCGKEAMVECGSCDGHGYFDRWGKPARAEVARFRSCLSCNGTGEEVRGTP